jgi:hypothetical protein
MARVKSLRESLAPFFRQMTSFHKSQIVNHLRSD